MVFANPKMIVPQLGLREGMEVADFGAGAGYFAVQLAECVGESGTVYVIDIQQSLLTKATHLAQQQHQDRLVYIHGDIAKLHGTTLDDNSVDMVLISNVLFQIQNKITVFKEAKRVVRDAGRVVVIEWRDSYGGIGPQKEMVVPKDEVESLAAAVHLSPAGTIDAGEYHYGVIFTKHV